MRILHVLESMSGGGGTVSPWQFATAAHKPGVEEHEFLSLGAVSSELMSTAPQLKVHARGHRSFAAVARWIADADYDILHIHWWERMPFLERLGVERVPPVVITADVYPGSPQFRLSRAELDLASMVVFDGRDAYDADGEVPPSKKRWIVGSAELTDYRGPRTRSDDGHLHLGRGSVLNRYKCPIDLIGQLVPVLAEVPDATFHVYGHGPLHRRFDREVRHNQLAGRVVLEGWVSNFPEAVRNLDIYLYHLPRNSFASSELNLQGAAAAGLPIILIPSDGTKWMFKHEHDALIADDPATAARFAARLAADPDERERLGSAAQSKASTDWGVGRMAEEYRAEVYEPMCAGQPSPPRSRSAASVARRVLVARSRRSALRGWRRARDLLA